MYNPIISINKQNTMSIESEHQPLDSKYTTLWEMSEKNIISKETKFGSVDIQHVENSMVEIQVHSPEPDNIWTVFKISPDGNVKTEVSEGPFGKPQDVEPAFTLEEVLAEIK